jgi:ABC-type branched-subunit amino acid transport system substrate-binding protein
VASPVAPGLYQTNVDAVKAWAADLNANGGLAGCQVVVDFCDSKLDPNATTNCVIKACQNDFALVGTAANALSDLSDLDTCKNAAGSTFGYGGATPANTVSLRKEAKLQGLNSVKVWACNSGCYDNSFIQQGGAAVDGTYAGLNYLPFYNANPKLAGLVKAVGGVNKLNGNAVDSYVDALLFQDAVAGGGSLTRQSFFAAMNKETSFNADGIIGPTNVATLAATPCVVIAQVQNGQWKRVYPAQPGTFDCSSANIATLKMNMNS